MALRAGTTNACTFDTPLFTPVSCCDWGYKAPDFVTADIGVVFRALRVLRACGAARPEHSGDLVAQSGRGNTYTGPAPA
jgi:hypothetical protein